MFGSVAYIGDIYVGMEGWVLSLPPCSSPSSQISCASPACGWAVAAEATTLFDISLLIWISGRFIWQRQVITWLAGLIMWTPAQPVEGGREGRRGGSGEGGGSKQEANKSRRTKTKHTNRRRLRLFPCSFFSSEGQAMMGLTTFLFYSLFPNYYSF